MRGGSPVSQEAGSGAGAAKAAGKTVRYTVDLDPELHRFLKIYALDSGARGAAVVRALLEELRDNPGLAERVAGRVTE